MREHTFSFDVAATPEEVWAALHPRLRPDPAGGPRVIEHGGVRIEILCQGDENGQGLVRTCTYAVPRWLCSGGVGRSWECVTESRPPTSFALRGGGQAAVVQGVRLASHRGPGRRAHRVHFGETYHAFNPVLRVLFERSVHQFISRDNDRLVQAAVEQGVARQRARRQPPAGGAVTT